MITVDHPLIQLLAGNAFIAAILAESGLSILGLGPQNQMTLGMMIYWSTINTSALLQNL
jgi:ABC-type dipeptide/oligopeptide/nickel transport system permease subunit